MPSRQSGTGKRGADTDSKKPALPDSAVRRSLLRSIRGQAVRNARVLVQYRSGGIDHLRINWYLPYIIVNFFKFFTERFFLKNFVFFKEDSFKNQFFLYFREIFLYLEHSLHLKKNKEKKEKIRNLRFF
jgi:hypothetical protein